MMSKGMGALMQPIDVRTLLFDALEDERKAEAFYEAVLERFGPVRPFVNIVSAERRHAGAIERHLRRLGIAIPENRWKGRGEAPASLAAACEQAIAGEVDNIALYDRLIPRIGDPAVRQLFENLQAASRENHLPAIRRCLERERRRFNGR